MGKPSSSWQPPSDPADKAPGVGGLLRVIKGRYEIPIPFSICSRIDGPRSRVRLRSTFHASFFPLSNPDRRLRLAVCGKCHRLEVHRRHDGGGIGVSVGKGCGDRSRERACRPFDVTQGRRHAPTNPFHRGRPRNRDHRLRIHESNLTNSQRIAPHRSTIP
jgi:hypothetical protein